MRLVALAGGTGAAKLLRGLDTLLERGAMTVVGNTGDDAEVWGLHVSPDLDTVCYTLGGVLDEERGWGLRDESFRTLGEMVRFGEPTWFNLGDRDLATHLHRTRLLAEGRSLSEVTAKLAADLGVRHAVLPMSDQPVRTRVLGPDGWLGFQEYFVREKTQVEVRAVEYTGAPEARPAPGLVEAIGAADAVLVCPSNPVTSVGPIAGLCALARHPHHRRRGRCPRPVHRSRRRAPGRGAHAHDRTCRGDAAGPPDSGDARMSTLVAVPVKDLVNAKQRLIPLLSAAERHDLASAMLEDVLETLARARLGPVLVVTRDREVESLALKHGAELLREDVNRGHTEAVAHAQREAAARGVKRFLTIPGDVPCATPGELAALDASVVDGPAIAFVPSLSGYGTNAVLLAPPDSMALKFGEPSFQNHVVAARAAGLKPVVLRMPGLGLDIDEPEDLTLLLGRGPSTRSAALLRRLAVPIRLASRLETP